MGSQLVLPERPLTALPSLSTALTQAWKVLHTTFRQSVVVGYVAFGNLAANLSLAKAGLTGERGFPGKSAAR